MCGLALILHYFFNKFVPMKKLFALGIISTFMLSCTSKNVINTNPKDVDAPAEVGTKNTFFNSINKKESFQQVKINSKIEVQTGKFVPPLDATMYIEQDKKVWMNVSVLINVARALATPDGIKAYEKWNKTYIESDFTYLNNLLNVNFINFEALQNLLIGKTFIPINEGDFKLTENATGFNLTSNKSQVVQMDGKSVAYKMTLDYSTFYDLNKVYIKEISNSGNELEVIYSNWENVGNSRFPKNVKIIIKGEKSGQILLENTKFDFNKMETPYSTPTNYTKTEIK